MPRLWLRAIFAVCFCAEFGRAQVVEITGGASTAYSAQGGSVLFHGERVDSSFGAGLLAGCPSFGGAAVQKLDSGTLAVGQQAFSLELPTDLFDAGHILLGSGLGLTRTLEKKRSFTGFAGETAQDGGSPLFRTASLSGPALFGQWRQPAGSKCFSTTTALFTTTRTGLESLECRRSEAAAVALTGGVGGGAPYGALSTVFKQCRFELRLAYIAAGGPFERGGGDGLLIPEAVRDNAAFEYRPGRRLTFSALHQNYLLPAAPEGNTSAESRSTLNDVSFSVRGSAAAGSLNLFQSSFRPLNSSEEQNRAATASFERTFGRLQWTEAFFGSLEPQDAHTANLINGADLQVDPHLRVSESVNVGAGRATFSHGGALLLRSDSFEVNYQLLYLANRPGNPFQNSLLFDAHVRLPRGLEAHGSSTVSPTGTTLYSLQFRTVLTHAGQVEAPLGAGVLGGSILHGRVVDQSGKPVSGAALLIGTARVYTDTDGCFQYREKSPRPHPFRVLTDEFLEPGRFSAPGAPATVRTGDGRNAPILRITVRLTAQTGEAGA